MNVHKCAQFCNNPRLVYERAVRRITKYLVSMSMYIHLSGGNQQLPAQGVVYRLDKENYVQCYVDADFAGECYQSYANNAEHFMSHMGYVITYVGCTVLWCSKVQM